MAQPPPYSPNESYNRYGPPPPGFAPPPTSTQFSPPPIHGNTNNPYPNYPPPPLNTTDTHFAPPPIHGNTNIYYPDSSTPSLNTTNINFSPPPIHGNTIVLPPEVIATNFGPHSQSLNCPYCHAMSRTKIVNEAGTKTHLMALCLCCFLCWPCACLPYCMDSCQVQNHYCGNCGAFLGSYDA